MPDPVTDARGAPPVDRLQEIKSGLPKQSRRDDWGGWFLTSEGEFDWPGSHVNWLISEVEQQRAELDRLRQAKEALDHAREINAGYQQQVDALQRRLAALTERPTHTEAQWEMSQGEVHDLRVLVAGIIEFVKCLEDGTWSAEQFIGWTRERKTEHDDRTLERFKNILRRHGRTALDADAQEQGEAGR